MTLKECVQNTPVARITRSNLKLNHKRQTTFKFWARDKLNRFYTLVHIESDLCALYTMQSSQVKNHTQPNNFIMVHLYPLLLIIV